jgi:hypothetical protein
MAANVVVAREPWWSGRLMRAIPVVLLIPVCLAVAWLITNG